MPKIPQPFSQSDIRVGSSGTQASGSDFFSPGGVEKLALGLSILGAGAKQYSINRDKIQAIQKEKDGKLWAQKRLSEFGRALSDYEVDPANQHSRDFLGGFIDRAGKLRDDLVKDAPSPEAAEDFLSRSDGIVDARYPRTAQQTAQNSLELDLELLNASWQESTKVFHERAVDQPNEATEDLIGQFNLLQETIGETFGKISPMLAKTFVDEKAKDLVLALSEHNTEKAKQFTLQYPFEETTRKTLLNLLETRTKVTSASNKDDFDLTREKVLIAGTRGEAGVSLPPIEKYTETYGERGEAVFNQDVRKIESFHKMHKFLADNAGSNFQEKLTKAEEFEKTLKTKEELDAYSAIVIPSINQEQRSFQNDKVSWLLENHPVISNKLRVLSQYHTDEETIARDIEQILGLNPALSREEAMKIATSREAELRESFYTQLLKYQGSPTSDEEDPSLFLNIPLGDRHIISGAEAAQWANRINKATPDEVVGLINSFLNKFPTDELKFQAMRDLSSLPADPLSAEYQTLFQNKDQSFAPLLVQTLRNKSELKELSPVSSAKLQSALEADPKWNRFMTSMIGPDHTRLPEMAGFREAIMLYARSLMLNGNEVKDAVTKATSHIIESTLAPIEIRQPTNGRGKHTDHLYLPRKKSDGSFMDDEEASDIGRRLSHAILHINPHDMDRSQFDVDPSLGSKEKTDIMASTVKETARWEIYDEKHMMLMIPSLEGDRMIPLRDLNGNTFLAPWEGLPSYSRDVGTTPAGKARIQKFGLEEVYEKEPNGYSKTWKGFVRKP